MEKSNQLYLPVTILIGCLILGGFYYATETSKQASIEKQQQADLLAKEQAQQADLQAKQDSQEEATRQANLLVSEKAACVTQAQNSAVAQYNNSYSCTGTSPSSDCFTGTYLIPNYNNYYDTCLQSKGLK